MTSLRPIALSLAVASLGLVRPAAACDEGRVSLGIPAAPVAAPVPFRAHPPPPVPIASAGVAVVLPRLPRFLAVLVAPPPPVTVWTPRAVLLHQRWLDGVRAAFHARWGGHPSRVHRFEAWERAYRAGLDRQWTLLAQADHPRQRGHGYGHRGRAYGHGGHVGNGYGVHD